MDTNAQASVQSGDIDPNSSNAQAHRPLAAVVIPTEAEDFSIPLRGASTGQSDSAATEAAIPRDITSVHRQGGLATRGKGSREQTTSASQVDIRFSDVDTLYVENAGLVILWPFLPTFFENLALLEGSRFRDLAAAQRAARLLDYLATEELEPPEYRLPLCKVLCGRPWDEVLDFEEPFSQAEVDECEGLLTAVIQRASILKEMSPSGFRGSFLFRPGALSAAHGAWLLRVERRTYDVVLDRFPWPIQAAKLPWMESPILVEW